MDQHQQVATYIFEKLRTAQINGDESETMSSAKQWLTMIANGQMVVSQVEAPKPDAEAKPDSEPDDAEK